MKKSSTPKASPQLKSPADLAKAVNRISVDLKGDRIVGTRLYSDPLQDSFRDSFTDGGTWRDTFVDGGQFVSNFNNLSPTASMQHPAISAALQKFQEAAKATESGNVG